MLDHLARMHKRWQRAFRKQKATRVRISEKNRSFTKGESDSSPVFYNTATL